MCLVTLFHQLAMTTLGPGVCPASCFSARLYFLLFFDTPKAYYVYKHIGDKPGMSYVRNFAANKCMHAGLALRKISIQIDSVK